MPGRRSSSSASASRSAVRAAPAACRGDGADLAGPHARGGGSGRRHRARAGPRPSPYQLSVDDRALGGEQLQRALQTGGGRARRARPGRSSPAASSGRAKSTLECGGDLGPARDRRRRASRRRPGSGASRRATQHPTMPAPTTATRSPTSGAASQRTLTAVSTVPASTARAGGTPSGTTVTALGRHDVGASGGGTGRRRCGRAAPPGPARPRRR